jgi:Xaa-Pro aminopeptidase
MKRIKKVQKSLHEYGVDALLVQNSVDLLYLTGMELSAGTLVIAKDDVHLVVDGRYFETCKKMLSYTVSLLAPGVLAKLMSGYKKVGFDADQTSYGAAEKLSTDLKKELTAIGKPIEQIRAIKEAGEIKALQRAADLCVEGFSFVCSCLKTGITEKTVAKQLELFWIERGADRLSFEPIIAFGSNSSMPHYRAKEVALKPGDVVLIDIGVVLDGYASDLTRTVFYGKPKAKIKEIYRIVQKAQSKAVDGCKAGLTSGDLYDFAGKVIEKAGYKEAFIHSLGHGIGLDVHEYPTLRENGDILLTAGMVVTIEPGIYIPDVGGVRIEDMVLITKDGPKVLTDCPKEELIIDEI